MNKKPFEGRIPIEDFRKQLKLKSISVEGVNLDTGEQDVQKQIDELKQETKKEKELLVHQLRSRKQDINKYLLAKYTDRNYVEGMYEGYDNSKARIDNDISFDYHVYYNIANMGPDGSDPLKEKRPANCMWLSPKFTDSNNDDYTYHIPFSKSYDRNGNPIFVTDYGEQLDLNMKSIHGNGIVHALTELKNKQTLNQNLFDSNVYSILERDGFIKDGKLKFDIKNRVVEKYIKDIRAHKRESAIEYLNKDFEPKPPKKKPEPEPEKEEKKEDEEEKKEDKKEEDKKEEIDLTKEEEDIEEEYEPDNVSEEELIDITKDFDSDSEPEIRDHFSKEEIKEILKNIERQLDSVINKEKDPEKKSKLEERKQEILKEHPYHELRHIIGEKKEELESLRLELNGKKDELKNQFKIDSRIIRLISLYKIGEEGNLLGDSDNIIKRIKTLVKTTIEIKDYEGYEKKMKNGKNKDDLNSFVNRLKKEGHPTFRIGDAIPTKEFINNIIEKNEIKSIYLKLSSADKQYRRAKDKLIEVKDRYFNYIDKNNITHNQFE